ncbi:MAG: heat-shock protein [Sulfurovum sp. FS06-10]|nr:MAG: heat-shock protein [Sulfurovum sp. FS06-10]
MLTIENLTDLEINIDQLETIAKRVTSKEIDLTICYNPCIQEYNAQYRNKNKPTDVLSFPVESDFEHEPLGSIVISADFVRQKALEFNHKNDDEFALLFIHGLLHLLGYDHELDTGEMRAKETELIHAFHLPKSLIIRTEES